MVNELSFLGYQSVANKTKTSGGLFGGIYPFALYLISTHMVTTT
jgi:hypothetical protein